MTEKSNLETVRDILSLDGKRLDEGEPMKTLTDAQREYLMVLAGAVIGILVGTVMALA